MEALVLCTQTVLVSLPLTLKLTPFSHFLSSFLGPLSIFNLLPLCPTLKHTHTLSVS